VARGDADPTLLDDYHVERHPIGEHLAEHTLAQSALITVTTPEGLALRSLLNTLIATVPEFSLALAGMLSALDVAYPSTGHPLTGTRVPGLFALLRSGRPVLLDLTGELGREASALAAALGIGVVVGEQPWTTAAVVLVRPDGHVWWASDNADDAEVTAALKGLGATFA
jgi:hypothetical protein